jgi:hypothetical protein
MPRRIFLDGELKSEKECLKPGSIFKTSRAEKARKPRNRKISRNSFLMKKFESPKFQSFLLIMDNDMQKNLR